MTYMYCLVVDIKLQLLASYILAKMINYTLVNAIECREQIHFCTLISFTCMELGIDDVRLHLNLCWDHQSIVGGIVVLDWPLVDHAGHAHG